MEDKETRPLVILILIVALLGEHCKFDQLRTENKGTLCIAFSCPLTVLSSDIAKDIDGISQVSYLTLPVYNCLTEHAGIHHRAHLRHFITVISEVS
jgi:hypothetical protein